MGRALIEPGSASGGNSCGEIEKSFLLQAGVPGGGQDSSRAGTDLRAGRHPSRYALPGPSSGLGYAQLSPGAALAPGGGGGRPPPDPFSQPAGGCPAAGSSPGTGGSPLRRWPGGYEAPPVRSRQRIPQESTSIPSTPGVPRQAGRFLSLIRIPCAQDSTSPHFSPGVALLRRVQGVRVAISRTPALPCGSFQEKRPIVNEDEPRMDTNKHE